MLKIVALATDSGLLVWKKDTSGDLVTKMGGYDVRITVRHTHENRADLNFYWFDGCNGSTYSVVVPAVKRFMKKIELDLLLNEKLKGRPKVRGQRIPLTRHDLLHGPGGKISIRK